MKNITNNGNNKPWVKIVVVRDKFIKKFLPHLLMFPLIYHSAMSPRTENRNIINDMIITINIYDKL